METLFRTPMLLVGLLTAMLAGVGLYHIACGLALLNPIPEVKISYETALQAVDEMQSSSMGYSTTTKKGGK